MSLFPTRRRRGSVPDASGGHILTDKSSAPAQARDEQIVCSQCGAVLRYRPGTEEVVCAYCGHGNPIAAQRIEIVENDLRLALKQGLAEAPVEETRTVKCTSCAAEFAFDPAAHAGHCPFCGQTVVADPAINRHIRPAGVLPFAIDARDARDRTRRWMRGLWFAPSELGRYARDDGRLAGIYLPYWTYDSHTTTDYVGRRGTLYYVQVPVQTVVNGRTVTRMQTVTRIRWHPVRGQVQRFFDDVLVLASRSLPSWLTDRLEPWDLHELRPYTPDYLTGFRSEAYRVPLDAGFAVADERMRAQIARDVRFDIGGDAQQIDRMEVHHDRPSFKHVLLPVWLGAFRYRGKAYRLCVNGRTGVVQGEYPRSVWKIALAVAVGLLAAVLVLWAAAGFDVGRIGTLPSAVPL